MAAMSMCEEGEEERALTYDASVVHCLLSLSHFDIPPANPIGILGLLLCALLGLQLVEQSLQLLLRREWLSRHWAR